MSTAAVRDRYLEALRHAQDNNPGLGLTAHSATESRREPHADVSSVDKSCGEVDASNVEPSATPPSRNQEDVAAAVETKVEDIDYLWERFKQTNQQVDRDELIVYYAPLVKYVASRVAAGLPQNVDQSDLISYGMFGLIDAIVKFDPERGFKFQTYAMARIKGAILDELRSIDWVPRSVRAKAKQLERATSKLEAKLHRPPTESELVEEMDITHVQLNNIYRQISSLGILALDEMISFGGSGDGATLGDTLADGRDGPGRMYEHAETRHLLSEAIATMGERERLVLTLYYYENLTLAQIGSVLGVTESRVCQIHTKSMMQLKSRMSAMYREPV